MVEGWISILLFTLNGTTALITLLNLLYLYHKFPKIKSRGWDLVQQHTTDLNASKALLIDEDDATDMELMKEVDFNRKIIQTYFYIVVLIPFGVSSVCNIAIFYPHYALWIFPAMNILIAGAYISFLQMMIMSCDGLKNLKKYFMDKPDECVSNNKCMICCNLCLKSNAWYGLVQRARLCGLIVIKPILNYITAYFQYFYGSKIEKTVLAFSLKILTLFTTLIPLNAMKSFHAHLLPITRMRRSTIKQYFISFLSPICQLQEVIVTLLFHITPINDLFELNNGNQVDRKYRWFIGYAILLAIEMLICSILIVAVAFRPEDLRLWQYRESLLQKTVSKLDYNASNPPKINVSNAAKSDVEISEHSLQL